MSRKPNEYEVQAALNALWAKARKDSAPNRYPDGSREAEMIREMWMDLARDQVRDVLEYAYTQPRIYTLDDHLDGYAPGNLKHHLAWDHDISDDVFRQWDPEGWEAAHRRAHAHGQTHERVVQE